MDRNFLALQLNAAIRLLAQYLDIDESQMMEIADLYPEWAVDKKYTTGQIVKYGLNSWGETQLYTVLKNHISKVTETPDTTPDMFKRVGVTDDGIPIWTQPLGKKDQYSKGDVVWHDGKKWSSTVNNNAYEPGVQGWTEVKG